MRERRRGRMEEYEECNAAAYAHSLPAPAVSHALKGLAYCSFLPDAFLDGRGVPTADSTPMTVWICCSA